ncbi:hypothetical protein [Haliscomenobacter sp.]|uniref:hypothetical protein n=1 Tax=Haliscomenobacter sp. TaxID=2717303 RepID=UPI003BAD8543
MSKELQHLLGYLATFIGLIPSLLALIKFRNASREYLLISFLVWWGTAIGLVALYIASFLHRTNLFLLHIYTIVDFILLCLIFKQVLPLYLNRFLLFGFPIFASINSVFFEHLKTENVLSRSISAFILMLYALSFFTKTLREMKIQNLGKEPLFWISVGVLFYNAASFFIFLFSHYLTASRDLWYTYFGIHAIFTILLYIFYTIALWVQPKQ